MKMLPYEQQDLLLNHSLKMIKSQDKDLDIVISRNISRSFENFFTEQKLNMWLHRNLFKGLNLVSKPKTFVCFFLLFMLMLRLSYLLNRMPALVSAASHVYFLYSRECASKTETEEEKLLNKVIIFCFLCTQKVFL